MTGSDSTGVFGMGMTLLPAGNVPVGSYSTVAMHSWMSAMGSFCSRTAFGRLPW